MKSKLYELRLCGLTVAKQRFYHFPSAFEFQFRIDPAACYEIIELDDPEPSEDRSFRYKKRIILDDDGEID